MDDYKIELIIPIGSPGHIMGFFFIGSYEYGDMYSEEDILALNDFRAIATPLVTNLMLYRSGIQSATDL